MSNEADKVINMSLCKMAESRTTRRGGSSLHKHLLIASVLTKATRARSAFLDTWYVGDDASENEANVDLNMSYQEADFPTDELDSTVGDTSELFTDASQDDSGVDAGGNTRISEQVESDIDLPPDILHCVEKIGDLNSRIFSSSQQASASLSDELATERPDCTNSKNPDLVSSAQPRVSQAAEDPHEDAQLSNTLTYLDLDAGSPTVVERGPAATSTPSKRRREWCFEDEDEDDRILGSGSSFCIETPVKAQSSSDSFGKQCKRLRFDDEDSGVASPEKSMDETGVPSRSADNHRGHNFKAGSFRMTYEDVDADDSDDDSFLEDALSESLQSPSQIQLAKTRDRNDRRVPSASSSSGSCSDEEADGENSMEVDQITNLVQFISFNKQQSQTQNSTSMRSISCIN